MKKKKGFYEKYIKRPQDFTLSLVALIILSPLLLTIAVLIKIKLGDPIIFKQKRPGLNEKIFTLYKFRTMTYATNNDGILLPDAERLTSFGKFLRSTSLDELPEFINILKGDMAIIGPRPQLVKDMVFMSARQRMRHSVRQGLTGLAQINGRNAINWEAKLNYDIKYINNITFSGDLKIFLKTVLKVFRKEGISADKMATAEDYGDYLFRTSQISQGFYDKKQEEAKKLIQNE